MIEELFDEICKLDKKEIKIQHFIVIYNPQTKQFKCRNTFDKSNLKIIDTVLKHLKPLI